MFVLALVGCGSFGLSTMPEDGGPGGLQDDGSGGRDADDPETDSAGDDGTEGGGPEESSDRVSVSLEGHTWAVDLEALTVVEPPGLGAFLSRMDSSVLLFNVVQQRADLLTLAAALGTEDGRQDPCERVVELPDVEWSNPTFAMNESTLPLTVGGHPLNIRDAYLSADIEPDASGWYDGKLLGTIDARELELSLGDGWDVCAILEDLGSACTSCADGVESCFELRVEDLEAPEAVGSFDPDADGC